MQEQRTGGGWREQVVRVLRQSDLVGVGVDGGSGVAGVGCMPGLDVFSQSLEVATAYDRNWS